MKKQFQHLLNQKSILITLQIAIVLMAIAVGFFGHQIYLQYRGDFALLREARAAVLEHTICEIPPDPQLEYGMIQGMLKTLDDPYTFFVEPAAHEVETDQLLGEYGGIGVRLERDLDENWRLYPLPDSPAIKEGIKDGDLLIRVDELAISPNTDSVTLQSALRGPEGAHVSLTILRNGTEKIFSIKREIVAIPSVSWNLLPDAPEIGLLTVHRIASSTAQEIKDGFSSLRNEGADAFILDLRDNSGGYVNAGVEIVDLFLSDGVILKQQYKDKAVETIEAKPPNPLGNQNWVVFVNQNTASAAEIVAGALLKNNAATLIGQQTFGKTVIQYVFELQDGSSIHVTSGRWWIPELTIPIEPNIRIEDDPNNNKILNEAIQILQKMSN